MNAASSEQRKATASATSSAVPNRPNGVRSLRVAWNASGMAWVSSVRTNPGATAPAVIEAERPAGKVLAREKSGVIPAPLPAAAEASGDLLREVKLLRVASELHRHLAH